MLITINPICSSGSNGFCWLAGFEINVICGGHSMQCITHCMPIITDLLKFRKLEAMGKIFLAHLHLFIFFPCCRCIHNYEISLLWKNITIETNLIEFKVCKYRNCKADGDWAITSAASLRALEAFCSPSATITWNFGHFL